MQQQYLVCNLPRKLGGLSVQELKDLLHESGIVRSKSNNFLKTKKDMCLALTLKGSDAFLDALRVNIDEFNPSLRDFAKIAGANAKISKQSADKLQKDKNKVRDLHHRLLMDNYQFPSSTEDLHMAGLQNRYESEKDELQAMYDRLQQKESEIRSMQIDLEAQKRNFSHPTEESGLAAVKMDVMQLKMQEKYLLNAIDEIRLHLNRLRIEDKSNHGHSEEIQSRILQLLDMKRGLEQSAHINSGKLETVQTGLSPTDRAEVAKLDQAANTLNGQNILEEDAEKIHKEVEEKQQDVEQLRVTLAAVRTQLQHYVEVFPRVQDAIAFAITSNDLQEKAKRLQNIIRAADSISKRVHDKMEKLSDSSMRTQQQDPDNVVSLLQNVDLILDKYDEVSTDVTKVDQTLGRAQTELKDLRDTFVSLAQRVDRNVDAAHLNDHELANILKDFIINRSYLKTAITDLHQEHGIAHSRTASVKSKLAEISDTLGRLENSQAVVGGGDGDDEDILNVLSKIEQRIKRIAQKQSDDRQTYLHTLNKYKETLNEKEMELKAHLTETLDQRFQSIRAEVDGIEQAIRKNNQTLREFVRGLEESKVDDKKRFSSLSKKAFELMEEQSVLFHGLKVKLGAVDFAETLKSFAEIEEEPLKHDETLFDDAVKRYDEELESITTLKAELKDALDEHSRLNNELSAVEFEIKKAEVRADADRLLEDLTQKRQTIELEIAENEKELKEYEAEVITHEQNISQINSGIDEDVFAALENAYQAQMASKSDRLERVNEELEEITADDSEATLEAHQQQLHRDATMKLQDIVQKLKEEISNIRNESGELDQLKAHKVNLLEREKQLTQKYLGTLEGRDNDLAALAANSKLIHDQHLQGLSTELDGQSGDDAYNARISQMMELEQQTKEKYESLQNECRERLNLLDQEKSQLLQDVRAFGKRAEDCEREKQSEIDSFDLRLEDVKSKLTQSEDRYTEMTDKFINFIGQFRSIASELEDLKIRTDPERVATMEKRLHDVEKENNRNKMLKTANDYLTAQVTELLSTQERLKAEALDSKTLTDKISVLEGTLQTQKIDLTKGRIDFERKSAEKASLDRQLEDIRSTIKNLTGRRLYKFDDPRSIAKEPVEAIRDIAEDYDFFRNAYQDTAKDLRDNIVELVKTLNQGNTMIDYNTIQSRVDALKYLPEDQQKERIKQTREMIADDYESLVKKGKEEARLLAKSYEAEDDWKQVETKINKLLAPVGSIEHSRESLKLINDFFRMTKSSMRRLQEEKQDVDIRNLHDNMIAYFETSRELTYGKRDNFVANVKRLDETSQKIKFDTLESAMYKMDERNSRYLQSFLDVFRLRSDELMVDLVRKLKRKRDSTKLNQPQMFNRVEDFHGDAENAATPDRWGDLAGNLKSRFELMSQLFPKIELLLFKISDGPIDEQIYFDASRFASNVGTTSKASQSIPSSLIDVGKYLYKEFYDALKVQLGDWLKDITAGNKPLSRDVSLSILDLKKFNVVQKCLYDNDCQETNKKQIQDIYENYGEPDSDRIYDVFEFKDAGKGSLMKYFEKIKKFVEGLADVKQSGGLLSDIQAMRHHMNLKKDILQAALVDKEERLNKFEQRGGRIVDANTIVPYDIRKLNAVLTRINDMVAANLKDLQKAKAAGFENAQYETKLKKIENDLLEKENLLSQFDGITKQSIERALLLEKELVHQNKNFEEFCLFLMGYRKDSNLNTSCFDSSKNVFGFRKEGKPIFEALDWHTNLKTLPKDELIFRSYTDKEHIKGLLKVQLKNLSFKSLFGVLEGLVSCHSYLQNSDSFYEEDMILQEIVSLRSSLDKLKIDEADDKMTLEAHFEDLKYLNDQWKLEMSCKHDKANIDDRNIKALFRNLKTPSLPSKISYVLSLIDSIKGKPSSDFWIDKFEFASQKNNTQEMDRTRTKLLNLKDKSKDPQMWLVLTLVEWPSIMEKYKIFNEPDDKIQQALASMSTGFMKLEKDCRDVIDLFQTSANEKIKDRATDVLLIVKEALALLDIVNKPAGIVSIARITGSQTPKSLEKRIFPKLFGNELSSKFAFSVKALVEETVKLSKPSSHSGGGIPTDAAKQFINQSDLLLQKFLKVLLPSKASADTSEVVEDQSPQTYDSFISTVMSTAGRENLEAMLETLNRVSNEIRKTPDSQDDNSLNLSTLLRVASKLVQERLECQNRTDELSATLSEKLYRAEDTFREQVKKCNERIHTANQKLLKAEDGRGSRGPTIAKGDGIAYGYILSNDMHDSVRDMATVSVDTEPSVEVKDYTDESPSRRISLPPSYGVAQELVMAPQSSIESVRLQNELPDSPQKVAAALTPVDIPETHQEPAEVSQVNPFGLSPADPNELREPQTEVADGQFPLSGQESAESLATEPPLATVSWANPTDKESVKDPWVEESLEKPHVEPRDKESLENLGVEPTDEESLEKPHVEPTDKESLDKPHVEPTDKESLEKPRVEPTDVEKSPWAEAKVPVQTPELPGKTESIWVLPSSAMPEILSNEANPAPPSRADDSELFSPLSAVEQNESTVQSSDIAENAVDDKLDLSNLASENEYTSDDTTAPAPAPRFVTENYPESYTKIAADPSLALSPAGTPATVLATPPPINAWESLVTEQRERLPRDSEPQPKPRPRQRLTADDAVFAPGSLQSLQKAVRNQSHNDFDDMQVWNDEVMTGGGSESTNKMMGHLLVLYIHYSRFIRKPQILRTISTVKDGSFIGALKASGIDEADTFYIDLLRLVFVDVSDLVLPEEAKNNEMSNKFMAFTKANTITYHMQLQTLDKGASERKVIRTDLFFRFCLDLLRSFDVRKLTASLQRINASIDQATSEKFTSLDLFLIQVMYQSDMKQNMIKLSNTVANQDSMRNINLSHTSAATSAVLTYVKIRCDQNEIWNERYRLGLLRNEATKREMLVEFNTHTFPYYNHDEENALRGFRNVSDDARRYMPTGSKMTWAVADNAPYQYHMLFGPFTKVFGPDTPVQQIARECDGIKTAITSGKSVLMMGYGASGSGKTSTLICQSDKGACKVPGILPNILADESITKRYRDVELSICELFAGHTSPEGEVHWKTKDMHFAFDGRAFNFTSTSNANDQYMPLPEHSERADDPAWWKLPIDEKTSIDTVIHHCIEVDRRSRGTTNNPNSSRSHVLVFIRFKGGPFMILGDFAGVENEFVCDDINTLLAIYNAQKCDDRGNCARVYNPSVAQADLSQFKRGQCGAGVDIAPAGKVDYFTLHGDDKRVPDIVEEKKMVSNVLNSRGTKGSLYSQIVKVSSEPKELQSFAVAEVESLLNGLRTKSDWAEEKSIVEKILFDKPESATYIELAKSNQSNIAGRISESNRKRLDFTISLIAAASATTDGNIWGSQVLKAIDAFVGISEARNANYNPETNARRKLKDLLQDRRDCFLNLFGFDGEKFEQAIRAEKTPQHELAKQLQSLAKRFAVLFDIKTSKTKIQVKKDEELMKKNKIVRIEQFLMAVIVAHIDAFDSSFQMVKRMVIICKCRTYEGRYINDSLEQVRNIVKDVIQIQQQEKGKLRTTPAFADACLPIYCNPFKEECLESEDIQSKTSKEISLNRSLLMNTISTKIGDTEFRDMQIAVFTVFLMNRTANNDPPVPFIYAEDLRSEYVRLRNFDSTKELAGEIESYLTGAAKSNMLKDIDRYESGLTTDIKPEIVSDLRVQISNQRARLGDNIANGLESQLSNACSNSMMTIKNLLRAIDGINAVHPVGTLQVTDAIAKFNMSDLYCSFSQKSSPFVAQLREKLEGNNCFVNLMQSKKSLSLLPPADPVDMKSKHVGGMIFDPKTMDEFLHQWLVTTGTTFSDYLYKLSHKVETNGDGQPRRKSTRRKSTRRKSSKGKPIGSSRQKNLKRKPSRRRPSIRMPARTTRKFF